MRGMDELEPGEWLVGLGSWVIQDGNYSDFAIGERLRFALEFFDLDLRDASPGVRSAAPVAEGHYDITAQVAYGADDLVLLDFGLLAYQQTQTPPAAPGTWRSGWVILQVDHYSYFEIYAKRPGVPPAVYTWMITGIWRQVAPYIPDPRSPIMKLMMRDPERLGYKALDRTDAWSDDDGRADYLIRCRIESDPPAYHP
jgi:hypothetical protein